jgi:hypothetical protein
LSVAIAGLPATSTVAATEFRVPRRQAADPYRQHAGF